MLLLSIWTIITDWFWGCHDTDFSQPIIFVTAIFIICHAISSLWSIGRQAWVIWSRRSAQCIAMEYIVAVLAGFTMALPYGWMNGLFFTLLSATIRSFSIILLFAAAYKVHGLKKRPRRMLYATILATAIGFIPGVITPLFTVVLIFIFLMVVTVPWQMLLSGTRGDVNIDGQLITLVGQIAWIVYGWWIDKPFVYISYGSFLLLTVVIIIFWLKFPKRYLQEDNDLGVIQIMRCNFFHHKCHILVLKIRLIDVRKRYYLCQKCERWFMEIGY